MKSKIVAEFNRLALPLVFLGLLAVGCGKKETTQVTPPAPGADTAPTTSATAPSPTGPASENPAAPDAMILEAKAAMKAKDYDKAIAAVSVSPQTTVPMTGQQLMSINSAKADVQNQLAAAAAAGDAKAKAAYEALRRRSMERP